VVERVGGADRYGNSAVIARTMVSGTAPVVYIASGDKFADD
jgi:predicted alpha/beta-hydrolase family hydrolase